MRKALLVLILACSTLGCKGIPVEAVRAYHDSVATGYTTYVNADARLNDNQRRIRLQTVKSMERLLLEAEK